MSCQEKKHCRDCLRWYLTGADQCNVPNPGLAPDELTDFQKANNYPVRDSVARFKTAVFPQMERDEAGCQFLLSHLRFIHSASPRKVFGHPSELNKDNDCLYHKALPRWLR
jgi:hypothetical protein